MLGPVNEEGKTGFYVFDEEFEPHLDMDIIKPEFLIFFREEEGRAQPIEGFKAKWISTERGIYLVRTD
jgi:hypothetical protein